MSVITLENIIPARYQDQIEAETTALGWYFHPESARPDLQFASSYGGFFHMAYDAAAPSPVSSAINAILVPLLFIFCDKAKVPFTDLIRVRLGLFTRMPVAVPHPQSSRRLLRTAPGGALLRQRLRRRYGDLQGDQ
jgi:hypothetical protein